MAPLRGVRGLEPGKRVAVVIHEWQRGTVDPELTGIPGLAAHAASHQGTENINRVTQAARAAGVPVFWSTIEPRADRVGTAGNSVLLAGLHSGTLSAGTAEADLHPGIEADTERDVWIRRVHGLTPFHGTELEPYLRERGVQTVILCGVSVDVGIPGAALEAVNRGFSVVVPADCTAASKPEIHEYIIAHQLRLIATISNADAVVAAITGLAV